jgi:hypothetical protein
MRACVHGCVCACAHNNSKNTACTIIKFSENVHIGPNRIPINFSYDPW